MTYGPTAKTMDEAIKAWNTRVKVEEGKIIEMLKRKLLGIGFEKEIAKSIATELGGDK